jgi:hypothetical protein
MSEMRDERGSVREVAEPGCAGPGSLIRHRYTFLVKSAEACSNFRTLHLVSVSVPVKRETRFQKSEMERI